MLTDNLSKFPGHKLVESDRMVPVLLEVNVATHAIKSDFATLRRRRRKLSDRFSVARNHDLFPLLEGSDQFRESILSLC